jgi:glyoxylase-like metal-dependent hydrolase (beta-lactamase superfamily II)
MENGMHQSMDSRYIPMTSVSSGEGREVAEDVFYYTTQIANLVFIGYPGAPEWIMVDAGMPKHIRDIKIEAHDRFGDIPPSAIVLTHGHFDHVGSIVDLIEAWNVPVYAHPQEFPFLTGQMSYPKPDTSVEGGLLAKLAFMYPREPIDISPVLKPLPQDGSVPVLKGWRWIHTPGHTPGHVSLFRESDGMLIAGDAFVTVRQDSLYEVILQKEEINGPPRYLTTDWQDAWNSVKKLEALNPSTAITGHGNAMDGDALKIGLMKLVDEFDSIAIPKYGKYVVEAKR